MQKLLMCSLGNASHLEFHGLPPPAPLPIHPHHQHSAQGWTTVLSSLCCSSPDVATEPPICGQRWGMAAAQEVGAFREEARSLQMGVCFGSAGALAPSRWKAEFPASS